MTLGIVIAHYAPDSSFKEVLYRAIAALGEQSFAGRLQIGVADDASDWTARLRSGISTPVVLTRDDVQNDRLLSRLDVDRFVVGVNTDRYCRAALTNLLVRSMTSEKLVFLDDDTRFRHRSALRRFDDYLNKYDVVFARWQTKNGRYQSFFSPGSSPVFGTTRTFFEALGGLAENSSKWGHGFDVELSWRLYDYLQSHRTDTGKACFASEIVTLPDARTRRRKFLVTESQFLKEFHDIYGVHPRENPSRIRANWCVHSSRFPRLSEAAFALRSHLHIFAMRVARARIGSSSI